MARVSAVIPAFNPGALIDVAIASVLGQTVKEIEIIVVDDGGDETLVAFSPFPDFRSSGRETAACPSRATSASPMRAPISSRSLTRTTNGFRQRGVSG